ncbi:MAG: DUF3391 domain-containing protein [Betaproteobacteria bacterium]|nr:MAG: DUF3391 domain-containing protein [Betaproteobacteria bacterium]
MYIAELDRPWTDTPFTFQGFVLKTYEELEILGRCCSFVLDCSTSDKSTGGPDAQREIPLE